MFKLVQGRCEGIGVWICLVVLGQLYLFNMVCGGQA
jgi:hypothetical protein